MEFFIKHKRWFFFIISLLFPLICSANVAFADLVPTIEALKRGASLAIPFALLIEIFIYKLSLRFEIKKAVVQVVSANFITMLLGYLIFFWPLNLDSLTFNLIFLKSQAIQIGPILLLYFVTAYINYFVEYNFINLVFKIKMSKMQLRWYLVANLLSNFITFAAIIYKLATAGFE